MTQQTTLNAAVARENRLLANLPDQSLELLLGLASVEHLQANRTLSDADAPIEAVYFPLTGVTALMAGDDDTCIEVASIGRDGLIGLPVIADTEQAAFRSVVRDGGDAVRVDVAAFRNAINDDRMLRAMVRRYTLALLTHLAQSVVCNRLHPVSARCARWLLSSHDRAPESKLTVTQEYVAQMLGVRRASVTVAAGALQRAGAIRYSRGRIQVLDRSILEGEACSCYRIARDEYERLLPVNQATTEPAGPADA